MTKRPRRKRRLGSPVYIYHVTANFKAWADRLGNAIHCSRLLGKYGAVVATAGGGGHVETADYLQWLVNRLGAQYVSRVTCALEDGPVPEGSEPIGSREIGRRFGPGDRRKDGVPGAASGDGIPAGIFPGSNHQA